VLTPSLAQEIAHETASVTGLGILITDPAGVVIGSSDASRIGTFHEASVPVVASHEPASHTAREAAELQGVRPGLTLPILVHGEVVGTVGITGTPSKVRGFGPVVRRHTEMLLHESAAVRSGLLREHSLEELVREISVYDPSVVEPDLLRLRARDLGSDRRTERVAVQLAVRAPADARSAPAGDLSLLRTELVRAIRDRFSDPADIVSAVGTGRFVAFRRTRSRDAREPDVDVPAECRLIIDAIRARHGLQVRVGIGSAARDVAQMHRALRDAADALHLGRRAGRSTDIFDIADLRTHQLVASFPPAARDRFVRDQLAGLVQREDWPLVRATLVAWCTSGFNLVATARLLHVHRNTVIYRLGRIKEETGWDPRDYAGAIAAYLACLCDQVADRAD
jgi:carbohydrate diacid regulator